MSKKGKKVADDQKKKNGTIMLCGKSREEVAQKFDELKASSEDATLMAGAVGQKADGTFELRIDIINA